MSVNSADVRKEIRRLLSTLSLEDQQVILNSEQTRLEAAKLKEEEYNTAIARRTRRGRAQLQGGNDTSSEPARKKRCTKSRVLRHDVSVKENSGADVDKLNEMSKDDGSSDAKTPIAILTSEAVANEDSTVDNSTADDSSSDSTAKDVVVDAMSHFVVATGALVCASEIPFHDTVEVIAEEKEYISENQTDETEQMASDPWWVPEAVNYVAPPTMEEKAEDLLAGKLSWILKAHKEWKESGETSEKPEEEEDNEEGVIYISDLHPLEEWFCYYNGIANWMRDGESFWKDRTCQNDHSDHSYAKVVSEENWGHLNDKFYEKMVAIQHRETNVEAERNDQINHNDHSYTAPIPLWGLSDNGAHAEDIEDEDVKNVKNDDAIEVEEAIEDKDEAVGPHGAAAVEVVTIDDEDDENDEEVELPRKVKVVIIGDDIILLD